jgi:SAM-dependent methyltransferase
MSDQRIAVRRRYDQAARRRSDDSSCGCACGTSGGSERFGYTFDELKMLPAGADLALGCGNPTALAEIAPGETILDLGSGGGIDCFLASTRTGDAGRVIGVDMTPSMIDRARSAAETGGYRNVEFRLGEIENLPVADGAVDLVISNCVINLSPDKSRVFGEVFRVLRPGGRLVVSDIVVTEKLPDEARASVALLTGCISGALVESDYLDRIRRVGFTDVDTLSSVQYATMENLEALAREGGIDRATIAVVAERTRSIVVRAVKR